MSPSPRQDRVQALALLGALLGGCTLQEAEPVVEAVEPDWAWTGEATDIQIVGERFFPTPVVDASSSRIDEGFVVELERDGARAELEAVQLEDWGLISARVPEGLEVGIYDLVVVSPDGEEGRLPAGFNITDNRADHLELDFDARPYQVDEQVVVRIHLLDPLGERVPEDFLVTVAAWVDDDEDAELDLSGTGLGDVSGSATELTGTLKAGDGWVALSSSAPANVWLGVNPTSLSSPVDGDEVFVPVTAGDLDRVQIDLIDDSHLYEAGTSFPVGFTLRDEFGNPLLDKSARLSLGDACGGAVLPEEIDFVGSVQREITFLRATVDGCNSTQLEVSGTATGESGAFEVVAGEVAVLQLSPPDGSPEEVVAGEEELILRLVAKDAYLNTVEDYSRDIDFRDDLGGLDTEQGIGSMTCLIDWNQGERYCAVGLEKADSEVLVEVIDSEGLSGWSDSTITVVPAAPESLLLDLAESEVAAGEDFELSMSAFDHYQNLVELDVEGADPVEFDDGYATLSCGFSAMDEGVHVFDCRSTTAADPMVLSADIATAGLSAASPPLVVVNGPLGNVEMTVPSSTTAGEGFTLSAVGTDSYGNAYTTGDPSVELTDDTGTLSPVTVTLDAAGLYSGSGFSLTIAKGPVTISASQGGADLGSVEIVVDPAELSSLAVELDQPWVWTGEVTGATVRGVDEYGNTVPEFGELVTLTSSSSLFIAVGVDDFDEGEATTTLTWDSAGLQDRVIATGSEHTGSSQGLDVLDDDCGDGPGADLLLDGGSSTVSCILSGLATASADFSGSTAGAASIAAYHFHDGDGTYTRGTGTTGSLMVSDPGAWLTELVVADADACGDRATAVFWANDKGEAAGPVTVSSSDSSRTAGGSATTADATITLTAEDCAGDVPTVTEVYVRTDLGELSSGVATASDGLTVTLSGTTGTFTWSAQQTKHDGTASIHAGVLSGAAHGSATISVSGESARPQVAWVDPSGSTEELLDRLTVEFTESLLGSVDYDSLVTVTGPSGEIDLSTSLDDDELSVEFDSQQDASSGSFALELSADIRDGSGNKLDGDYDGSNASFSAVFGDVVDDAVTVDSCDGATKKVTPDGSGGSGAEADDFDVAVSASATPEWWLLEVYDNDDTKIRTQRVVPGGSTDTVSWDARGSDGIVVVAGSFRVDISSVDTQDNLSVPCESTVRVVEHYVAVE